MSKIYLKINNWKVSMTATFFTLIFGIIIFLVPSVLIFLIPQSALGKYFINNIYYTYLALPIILYISLTGIYYYSIKIDAYIMHITSYRTISGLLKEKNYIELPHDMLIQYNFFNRSFSVNKTLMLKMKDTNEKIIIKRFNLSFLSYIEKQKICKVLDQIIAKNS